jgi:dienelactone hydrolase
MVSLLFSILNGHKKALILLHEIYGLNNDIYSKSRDFTTLECDVYCPDFLSNNLVFDYDEDAKAYSNFVDNVGFDQAYDVVMNLYKELTMTYDEIYIVGYSVGTTVAWMMSEVVE